MYLEAIAIPDPDNAVLKEILNGEAEQTVLGRFEEMAKFHQRAIPPEPSVYAHDIMTITFPEADIAVVRECLVDDLQLIQDASAIREGAIALIDGDTVTVEVTTSLHRGETGWQITVRESTEYLEGIRDCQTFSP